MTGVERLQQVEGFTATHFADNDAVRPMPKARLDQIAYRHFREDQRRGAAGLEAERRFGLHSRISAAVSSIRMIRSWSGIPPSNALRSVVVAGSRASADQNIASCFQWRTEDGFSATSPLRQPRPTSSSKEN